MLYTAQIKNMSDLNCNEQYIMPISLPHSTDIVGKYVSLCVENSVYYISGHLPDTNRRYPTDSWNPSGDSTWITKKAGSISNDGTCYKHSNTPIKHDNQYTRYACCLISEIK